MKKYFIIGGLGLVVIVILVIVISPSGSVTALFRGNVYSCGYRDVYIQAQSMKPDKLSGLGRVHEIKCSHHGYGSGVDPNKAGQNSQGAWIANHFSDELRVEIEFAEGDVLYRVFYLEKDFTFAGATKYHVQGIYRIDPNGDRDGLQKWTEKMFEKTSP